MQHDWCSATDCVKPGLLVNQSLLHDWCSASDCVKPGLLVNQSLQHDWCSASDCVKPGLLVNQSMQHDWCSATDYVKLVFCRFVLPCQIFLPPIKTVSGTIRQRKILPVKLYFINLYTYHNPKLTLRVMSRFKVLYYSSHTQSYKYNQ